MTSSSLSEEKGNFCCLVSFLADRGLPEWTNLPTILLRFKANIWSSQKRNRQPAYIYFLKEKFPSKMIRCILRNCKRKPFRDKSAHAKFSEVLLFYDDISSAATNMMANDLCISMCTKSPLICRDQYFIEILCCPKRGDTAGKSHECLYRQYRSFCSSQSQPITPYSGFFFQLA